MVEYVPYMGIVLQPIRKLRQRYGDQQVLHDLTAGEIAQEVTHGNIALYRIIVSRSSGFGFYHHASNTPHQVITPDGDSRHLWDAEQIRQFYSGLPEAEKRIIREAGDGLAELV